MWSRLAKVARCAALYLFWVAYPAYSIALEIDFEDAYFALGHAGDPAEFYVSDGLTIRGTYFGIIQGVSRGDAGNFDLEGSNGAASLAINDTNQIIDLRFNKKLSSLCFDIGTAFFTQLPEQPQIRIRSYDSGNRISSEVISIADTLMNGNGTWHGQSFLNIDRVTLEPIDGRLLWAIDNLQVDESCAGNPAPPPPPQPPTTQPSPSIVAVILLLLSE